MEMKWKTIKNDETSPSCLKVWENLFFDEFYSFPCLFYRTVSFNFPRSNKNIDLKLISFSALEQDDSA